MRVSPEVREGFGKLADVGVPVMYFLGALLFGTVTNSFYDVAESLVGESLVAKVVLGLLALLVLALAVAGYVWRIQRGVRAVPGQPPPAARGLICLVSRRETVKAAVQHHRKEDQCTLKRCWLIHTPERLEMAQALQRELSEGGTLTELKSVDTAFDYAPTEAAVNSVYAGLNEYGLAEEDVIADFTGATALMSAGMIVACLRRTRLLEYLPGTYREDADGNLIVEGPAGPPIYIHIVR